MFIEIAPDGFKQSTTAAVSMNVAAKKIATVAEHTQYHQSGRFLFIRLHLQFGQRLQEKRSGSGAAPGNLLVLYKHVIPIKTKRQLLFTEADAERVSGMK
jgi:hypothetical protein